MESSMRLVALLTLLFACSVTGNAAESGPGEREIHAVIDQFRESIVTKDKEGFVSLFLHDRVTWQPVMSDARYALSVKSDPEAAKVAYNPGDTPEKFIDGIVKSTAKIEETFSGIVIDSDGAAASVAFDFKFLSNGTVTNSGREYWLLVKTATGWKIAAVTWSRNTPAKASS